MSAVEIGFGEPSARWPAAAGRFRRRTWPGIVLGLSLLVLLLAAPERLMDDPDPLWHVAVGRDIWFARAVPWHDAYSYTFAGAPWIAKEWLSQLVLFAAHAADGWRGVVLVAALAIAGAFTLLYTWLRTRAGASAALAATLLAALLASPHFLARPHALVLPLVVLWMTALVGAVDRRRAPPLWLVPVMALWANMHGSFPLGLAVAGVLAGEGVLIRPGGSRLASLRRWALFLVLSLGATMLSPYGWHAIVVPLRMSGNAETLRFIGEWQPLRLDLVGSLALALLAIVLGVLARAMRRNLFRLMATGLLAYLMIRHLRFIELFAVAAPILAARSWTERRSARPAVAEARAENGAADERIVRVGLFGAGLALAAAAIALVLVMHPGPSPRHAPAAALDFAAARHLTGPVYNDYDFGGFLIARDVKTFVDGRTDQLFLGDFLPTLDRAIKGPDAQALATLLARHGVRWALVRSGSAAATRIAALPGWTKLYQDDVAAVLVAKDEGRRPPSETPLISSAR